jgi:membrane protein insertase Oxa1/YidC/SpoIIIJ
MDPEVLVVKTDGWKREDLDILIKRKQIKDEIMFLKQTVEFNPLNQCFPTFVRPRPGK